MAAAVVLSVRSPSGIKMRSARAASFFRSLSRREQGEPQCNDKLIKHPAMQNPQDNSQALFRRGASVFFEQIYSVHSNTTGARTHRDIRDEPNHSTHRSL